VTRRRTLILAGAGAGVLLIVAVALVIPGLRPGSGRHNQAGPTPSATLGMGGGPAVSAAPTGSAGPTGSAAPATWWRPKAGLSWQWQLSGTLDPSVAADVYDIDAVSSTAAQVAALHGQGRKVICYVNAGAYENFRPDAGSYPKAVLGNGLDGWPGERWLDVRRWDVLQPILAARFATCRTKGFDGVEPDNVDGYDNDTGFPLTAADQLTFNRRVADLAHRTGLAVGLKNDVEQASALVAAEDYAVDEECARYRECDALRGFISAGKPVFHAEYDLAVTSFCPVTRPLGFSSIRKHLDLGAWRQTC
jgi:hypothetical protein